MFSPPIVALGLIPLATAGLGIVYNWRYFNELGASNQWGYPGAILVLLLGSVGFFSFIALSVMLFLKKPLMLNLCILTSLGLGAIAFINHNWQSIHVFAWVLPCQIAIWFAYGMYASIRFSNT